MVWASPLIVLILLALLLASSLRILREYQRGVVFQLGRFWRVKGPGTAPGSPSADRPGTVDQRFDPPRASYALGRWERISTVIMRMLRLAER